MTARSSGWPAATTTKPRSSRRSSSRRSPVPAPSPNRPGPGARGNNDWNTFAPHLEKLLGLQREAAEHLGYEDHPYDAMLDNFEPGARKVPLEAMFEELKAGSLSVLKSISGALDEDRSSPLHGSFDENLQEEFGRSVVAAFGYDWSRGRQDRTVHPFCVGINPGDVRITTRFDPECLSLALFATLHESGHGMYEQGINPDYFRTPLNGGTSMGVHESQSRMWENLVGRSRPFLDPLLSQTSGDLPRSPRRHGPRNFLPRDQRGPALRDKGRSRRADL